MLKREKEKLREDNFFTYYQCIDLLDYMENLDPQNALEKGTQFKQFMLDKNKEFAEEINEKVVNKLNINQNNQKYLPKDYYDNPENKNFGERLYNREKIMKEDAMKKAKLKAKLKINI